MVDPIECVATCRPGLESVLQSELVESGIRKPRKAKRAVHFTTNQAGLYRLNMALRSAIQILVPIRTFNAPDYERLYFQARKTNWHKYFENGNTIRIDVNGRSPSLRNTQYVVHRVKDGIVDTFRKLSGGVRPSIDKDAPDVHVVVHLDGQKVTLCLDSSGVPLFKRGYRLEHGGAPLKEDLAAGILLMSGLEKQTGLVDPMCGSGTFLFEGWMILNGIAPNLNRSFAFQNWLDYDEDTYLRERQRLSDRENLNPSIPVIGCDIDEETHALAERIRDTHFGESGIQLTNGPFQEFIAEIPEGLLVTNPPYGERMGNAEELTKLYVDLGYAAKRFVPGGRMAVFTANRKAAKQIRMKAEGAKTLFNGAIEGLLFEYSIRGPRPD
ncbi:MAG: class I SAM-dependent RNA methyltransferase [Puniceicoccaceae bacterium]